MPAYSPFVPITIPPLAFGATGMNIPDAFVHTATGSCVAHMERVTKAIKEHELFYDIILTRKTTYKAEQPFGFEDTVSFGFIRTC